MKKKCSRIKIFVINCCTREECKRCEGTGLGKEAAHTRIGDKTITEIENMYLDDLLDFLQKLPIEKSPLQKELEKKLKCLCDVGLTYLSLNRTLPSLSGGEIQRLFLASYIIAEGSPLELKKNPSSIIGKYLRTR